MISNEKEHSLANEVIKRGENQQNKNYSNNYIDFNEGLRISLQIIKNYSDPITDDLVSSISFFKFLSQTSQIEMNRVLFLLENLRDLYIKTKSTYIKLIVIETIECLIQYQCTSKDKIDLLIRNNNLNSLLKFDKSDEIRILSLILNVSIAKNHKEFVLFLIENNYINILLNESKEHLKGPFDEQTPSILSHEYNLIQAVLQLKDIVDILHLDQINDLFFITYAIVSNEQSSFLLKLFFEDAIKCLKCILPFLAPQQLIYSQLYQTITSIIKDVNRISNWAICYDFLSFFFSYSNDDTVLEMISSFDIGFLLAVNINCNIFYQLEKLFLLAGVVFQKDKTKVSLVFNTGFFDWCHSIIHFQKFIVQSGFWDMFFSILENSDNEVKVGLLGNESIVNDFFDFFESDQTKLASRLVNIHSDLLRFHEQIPLYISRAEDIFESLKFSSLDDQSDAQFE